MHYDWQIQMLLAAFASFTWLNPLFFVIGYISTRLDLWDWTKVHLQHWFIRQFPIWWKLTCHNHCTCKCTCCATIDLFTWLNTLASCMGSIGARVALWFERCQLQHHVLTGTICVGMGLPYCSNAPMHIFFKTFDHLTWLNAPAFYTDTIWMKPSPWDGEDSSVTLTFSLFLPQKDWVCHWSPVSRCAGSPQPMPIS